MTVSPEQALAALRELHAEVDAEALRLAELHAGRLECRRGCSACCVDEQSVFELEAERIRREHPELLASAEPHPEGACAFLDSAGACRVYESRPYRCRTQGLPLRWFDEGEDGAAVEYRDVCELNLTGEPPVEALDGEQCWELGPIEGRLAALSADSAGGQTGRVLLRSLFSKPVPQG